MTITYLYYTASAVEGKKHDGGGGVAGVVGGVVGGVVAAAVLSIFYLLITKKLTVNHEVGWGGCFPTVTYSLELFNKLVPYLLIAT